MDRIGSWYIERFVDEQIQVVKSQRQLAVEFGGLFMRFGAFQAPRGSPKSVGQSSRLFVVPQAAEESPHLLRSRARHTNHAQCFGAGYTVFLNFLEQETLKMPAMSRARAVNAAPAAAESRARLQEP
jgi:hypothetical protein